MFPAVTTEYFMPIALSWFSTPAFAAAPTSSASTWLKRSMPTGPSRLSSLRVIAGIPLLVT